jgi:tetratricopeptide (TPR) repeat protein
MSKAESGIGQDREAIRAHRALFLLASLAIGMAIATLSPGAQSADSVKKIQQLLEAGDTASAQALLSQALRESPNGGGLYNLQGVLKAQEGDFASAEASFRKAIELEPHLEGAYLNLGRLYQEHVAKDPGAREKALGVYAALLGFAPGHREANYQIAALLMQKGLYTASLQHLARLPATAQSHSQALSIRCGDYAGLGQHDKAKHAAELMLHGTGLAEADVTSILPILASRKETAIALDLLQGLAVRQFASFDSLRSLGLLYRGTGRLAEAREALEAAAQLEPDSVPNLLDLARVADDQKDYRGALGYLAHARALEPGNAAVHFLWGMTCVQENLAEEAYQALKKAASLDPQNAYYIYAVGAVAMQRDDASESIPYFQKYCELKPRDRRGRLALGAAYFNSFDSEKAAKVLDTVIDDPETAAGAHYYLGRIANRQGDYAEAVRHLRIALKAYPDYADAYAELGSIHLKQKQYPQAEEALQKALKLRADSYTANLNLLILYQRIGSPKAEEQAKRFEQVKEERAQRAREFLRGIRVEP